MRGACVRNCPNPHLITFKFKVYKNPIDFGFDFPNMWEEVNMTDSYFLGF